MELKIFAGSASKKLAQNICKELNVNLGGIYLHMFPSGEPYCQFEENIRGCDVYLIQSICNPAHERLVELLVMIDAAKRASAGRITVVTPYLGFLRQDRKTKSRTPISGKLMADMLTAAGASRVVGMDFHCDQAQGFFNIPVDHLYAAPIFVEHFTRIPAKRISSAETIVELIQDLIELYPDLHFSKKLYPDNTLEIVISDKPSTNNYYWHHDCNFILCLRFSHSVLTVITLKDRYRKEETSTSYALNICANSKIPHIPKIAIQNIQTLLEKTCIKSNQIKPIIVSPDAGGIKRAEAFAASIGTDFTFLSKKRINDNDVEVSEPVGNIRDRNVIIIDDLTESCGTIIEAAKACKLAGATLVVAAVTHGLLNITALERLNKINGELDELVVTDTAVETTQLPHVTGFHINKVRVLSVAPLFAKAIKHINENKSITELFISKTC